MAKLATTELRLVNARDRTRQGRLTVPDAAAYVGCKTVKAFYAWRKRRFLPSAKVYRSVDLDVVMKADERRRERARRTRRMHPASLANLRRQAS